MRSTIRRSVEIVLRIRTADPLDHELAGLCVILLVVVGGHLLQF